MTATLFTVLFYIATQRLKFGNTAAQPKTQQVYEIIFNNNSTNQNKMVKFYNQNLNKTELRFLYY